MIHRNFVYRKDLHRVGMMIQNSPIYHEDETSSHCLMKLYVAGFFHASLSYEIFFCK